MSFEQNPLKAECIQGIRATSKQSNISTFMSNSKGKKTFA